MRNTARCFLLLSAVSTIILAGPAQAAQTPCPSVTFRRVPVPTSTHRVAPRHPHKFRQLSSAEVAARRLARALPGPKPILAPDIRPSTPVVLPSDDQPAATPVVAYRLERSVAMVACEVVPLVASAADNPLLEQIQRAPVDAGFIPASFASSPPLKPSLFSTLPPGTNSGGGGGGGGPPGFRPPPVGVVPEPATWAMLLVGFFSLGARLRQAGRRTRNARAALAPSA